ncbi:hypothetical protein BHM03_00025396 [Ensete ventricosum]|nr:hypothetical protein BHM03_00025396 [Ensete ventricosum]
MEFTRKRPKLAGRLSGVAEKLAGIWDGLVIDVSGRAWTMQWDLAGRSLGDSPKGSGSSLGACREIIGRRLDDLPQECRRLPDWRKLGLSLSL